MLCLLTCRLHSRVVGDCCRERNARDIYRHVSAFLVYSLLHASSNARGWTLHRKRLFDWAEEIVLKDRQPNSTLQVCVTSVSIHAYAYVCAI